MSLARLKLFLLTALTVAAVGACSTKPRFYIKVEVLGAETSCQNMDIDFTSYDYNGVLDSLTKLNNPGPRPDSSDLMVLLDEYQKQLASKTAMSDSVNSLRDDLEKMNNTSIEYRKLFPIFQDLQKREQQASEDVHQVHQKYLEIKGAYQEKVNAWREKAFTGFTDFKNNIQPELQTKTETTDQNCTISKLDLPFGRWWLNAELRRPGTINEKLVWNIQLPTKGDSVLIILDESNADVIRELL
ncbi:hypothetical protein LLH00_14205 [bacterium]|nr:hypothetical protein [bacterium]